MTDVVALTRARLIEALKDSGPALTEVVLTRMEAVVFDGDVDKYLEAMRIVVTAALEEEIAAREARKREEAAILEAQVAACAREFVCLCNMKPTH